MTLADEGFLELAPLRLEYRMIGPRPSEAPTIVMLHEGLGCVGLWGTFPQELAAATGAGVFVYSRTNYGQSSAGKLPRTVDFMHEEALGVLPHSSLSTSVAPPSNTATRGTRSARAPVYCASMLNGPVAMNDISDDAVLR